MSSYKTVVLVAAALAPILSACQVETDEADLAAADSAGRPFVMASDSITAGRYLVVIAGCNDCHTPGYLENPTAVPESEWLTGVPVGFRGPWGTTYPKNLRLTASQMDADTWVQTLHTRTALPPMPWINVNSMSEQDARAIYHYIRTLQPVGTAAPLPVPPGQEPATPYIDFEPQHMERLAAPPPAPPPATPRADTTRADSVAAPAPSSRQG